MTESEKGKGDSQGLTRELELIQKQANQIASKQFAQAQIWRFINLLIGLPAVGVAAIAGGIALSSRGSSTAVGILALSSAAMSSLNTFLGAQRRQTNSERCGNSYLEVRNAARRLLRIDLPALTYSEARVRLGEIALRQEEVNRTAEPPSRLAIWLGARYIARKKTGMPELFPDAD
ncbi:SLATT domain-containing protein [Amycolatopsis sp. NPDC098790]|uniref:SLATT domain-containing protein n=1 Tax=Amycolatopsis sp. NPDC098790 TaxID=3363939 RepID=UPI00381E1E11